MKALFETLTEPTQLNPWKLPENVKTPALKSMVLRRQKELWDVSTLYNIASKLSLMLRVRTGGVRAVRGAYRPHILKVTGFASFSYNGLHMVLYSGSGARYQCMRHDHGSVAEVD